MKTTFGLDEKNRKDISDGLGRFLADTYTLYLKTHNYHWNVTGPHFPILHTLFETHYTDMAVAVDEIAERIRALGFPAPGSYGEFAELSSVKDERGVLSVDKMIESLLRGHEAAAGTARAILPLCEKAEDVVTQDLLTGRIQFHEKTGWMLRTMMEKN